jgi:hypothetical protein
MEFIKSRERKTKGAWRAQVESTGRENVLFFFRKPTLTHGEGRPRRFPPSNEWEGAWMAPSQVRVVWTISGQPT